MAKKKTAKKKAGDISKQVYKFQEGITAIALEVAGYPLAEVHWPAKGRPKGLTVDVDVLIGDSVEESHTNISVKHLTSGKESEKGGWRMMREIIDSKCGCENAVGIYNVVFDSQLKDNWEKILVSFFDGYLVLESEGEWGAILIRKAYDYLRGDLAGVDESRARTMLREAIDPKAKKFDEELASAVASFSSRLKEMLSGSQTKLEGFWKIVRAHLESSHPSITPKHTSLKRGLAKFLILEKEDREKVYDWFESSGGKAIEDLPMYTLELGLAEEDCVGEWEVIDEDILRVFNLIPGNHREIIECIYDGSPVERMLELYIRPLRSLQNTLAFLDFVVNYHSTISDPEKLNDLLWAVHDSPNQVEGLGELESDEATNWLYKIIISVLKAHGGTSQSSGFSKIGELSGVTDGISSGYISLADFVNRKSTLKINSSLRLQVRAAADVFAAGLKEIGPQEVDELRADTRTKYIQRLLETGLIPYRSFDPIGLLVKGALAGQGLKFEAVSSFQTAAREFSDAEKGGTTKLLEVSSPQGRSFVLWQSPNKNARDKAKEFAARCACLIGQYDSETESFVSRGVRVFMVIDGIWDQEDIDSLLKFGCEHVYYPDEIDQLVAALKPGKEMPMAEAEMPMAAEGSEPLKLKRKGGNG